MKKLLKGVIALTVLSVILITVENFIPITSPLKSDMGSPIGWIGILLLFPAAGGVLLLLCGAAGRFVAWVVSQVARDKEAAMDDASVSIATVGVIVLVTLLFGYMTSPPRVHESYHENGQLHWTGSLKDGERHGPWEWYYPNGQLYWKGNFNANERVRDDWGTQSAKCGEWFEDGETVTYDPCPPDLEDGN